MALRQIMTPNGPMLLAEEDLAGYGIPDPMASQGLGAPILPPPALEPVPDVAFNQPPPMPDAVSGAGEVVPGMAPRLTPGLADSGLVPQEVVDAAPAVAQPDPRAYRGGGTGGLDTPDASAQAGASGAPLSEEPAPAPQQRGPVDLAGTSWNDIANQQAADVDAETAATLRLGESEAKAMEAKALAMESRDRALAARQQEAEAKAQVEQAEVAKRAQIWQDKQTEWMNAKVVRRGMNTGEILGALVAGFGSAMKGQGDRNPALDMAMANIERNVDDQIRERDELGRNVSALKGSVDYAREIAKDSQAARMAAIGFDADRMGREIETVAAKMAPSSKRDETALAGTLLRQKGTSLLVASKQQEEARLAQERALAEQIAARKASNSLGWANNKLSRDQFDQSVKTNERDFIAGQADKAFDRAMAITDRGNEAAKIVATGKTAAAAAAAAAAKEEKSTTIYNPAATGIPDEKGEIDRVVRHADGTPFAPDEAAAKVIRPQMAAMATLAALAEENKQLIEANGGELTALKSAAFQKVKSNQAVIANMLRSGYEMGTLDKSAMELAQQIQGADPTSFMHDGTPGLEQMISQAERKLDFTLKGYGWRPPAGQAFRLMRQDAPAAPVDRNYDAAIQGSANAPDLKWSEVGTDKGNARVAAAYGRGVTEEQALGLRDLSAEADGLAQTALKARVAADANPTPAAKKAAKEAASAASDKVKKVMAVAEKADNPAQRDAAVRAIEAMAAGGNPYAALEMDRLKKLRARDLVGGKRAK